MRIGPALGAQHAASRTVQAPPLLYFAPPLSGVATPSYQPMRPRFAGRARAEPEKPEKPPSPSPTISTIVNLVGAPGEDASSSDAKSKNVADTTGEHGAFCRRALSRQPGPDHAHVGRPAARPAAMPAPDGGTPFKRSVRDVVMDGPAKHGPAAAENGVQRHAGTAGR